ncbi:AraC family transcriptional regulator [Rhizobium sp. Root1203]|uniref:AraC family transcriptional regulator n=1 Tax=Rhizobium sp. Root1203 TaxID=1736427 RepID=UPI000A702E25|nr:AraC family transcriptional regulator [Rhizobium sp. Root1203]
MPRSLYARSLSETLKIKSASAMASRSFHSGAFTATLVERPAPGPDPTEPSAIEDAFVFAVWQGEMFRRELWIDGRPIPTEQPLSAGAFSFLDLRQRSSALFRAPVRTVLFHLPKAIFKEISDESGGPQIDELMLRPGRPYQDKVVAALAQAFLPALEQPDHASRLFVDHVARALAVHALQTYGGLAVPRCRGGLAPWQRRRLLELLDANLGGDLTLADMAGACDLSTRHLVRAFGESFGMPPYRWLMMRRIERARALLGDGRMSIAEIALACGFADQSHFTRAFTKATNLSPAAWRRQMRF